MASIEVLRLRDPSLAAGILAALKAKDDALKAKDDVIQLKDDALKAKDDAISAMQRKIQQIGCASIARALKVRMSVARPCRRECPNAFPRFGV